MFFLTFMCFGVDGIHFIGASMFFFSLLSFVPLNERMNERKKKMESLAPSKMRAGYSKVGQTV